MKKITIFSFIALTAFGCSNSAPTKVENQPTVSGSSANRNEMTVMSHSQESVKTAPTAKTSTESPMAKPIDVSAQTAKIAKAETDFKAGQTDAKARENLTRAYFERAFALTEAAQYRAALGDFRRGLKLDPNDREAKAMHDQILSIFKSINREPPKEGEEPAPLPFEKKS